MDVELCSRSSPVLLAPRFIRDGPLFLPGLVARLTASLAGLAGPSEKASADSWEENYHLSDERANVLRLLPALIQGSVLEIGSECGALTGFLGENSTSVMSIETDPLCRRAAIERCRDLLNVRIVGELPQDVNHETFDCIVVSGGPDRVDNFEQILPAAAQLLKSAGTLILTASNNTALDLLAGASVENEKGTSVGALQPMFDAAGFRHIELFYLFPGWRFPRLIIPSGKFRAEVSEVVSNLVEHQSAEQDLPFLEILSRRRTWPALIAKDVGPALAPAFAFVAYKGIADRPAISDELIGAMVNVRRLRAFRKVTTVLDTPQGLFVRRTPLHADANEAAQSAYRQTLSDEPYIAGTLLSTELYRRLDTPGWTFEDLSRWARRYLEFLASHSIDAKTSAETYLPPNMVDCTPFNIVVQANGTLRVFDLEWIAPEPLPIEFVFFRGLLYTFLSVGSVAQCGPVPTLVIVEIIRDLIRGQGYPFEFAKLQDCWERELALQAAIAGPAIRFDRATWEAAQLRIRSGPADMGDALGRFEAANSELQRAQTELRARVSEIEVLQSGNDQLSRQLSAASRRIAKQYARIRAGLERARSNSERLASAQTEIEALRRTVAEHERQLVAAGDSLQERDVVSEGLRRELDLQRTSARLWAKHAAVARRELDDIQRSISWRSTGPVRIVISLLLGVGKHGLSVVNSARLWLLIVARCINPRRLQASRRLAASGLFDRSSYLARYPDIAAAGIDPLVHYLAIGEQEARSISPLFDEEYYRKQISPLGLAGLAAVDHFLNEGGQQGRSPSKYFDAGFYLQNYPAVGKMNPLIHYLRLGAWEGANPSPWFDTAYYLATNPDLAESGLNPLLHYVTVGERAGRKTSAPVELRPDTRPAPAGKVLPILGVLFARDYYLAKYPEVAQSGMDPLDHFLSKGAIQGYNPHPLFHARFYLDHNEDVRKSGTNPLLHFVRFGAWEGRDPNPIFDCAYYLQEYPDVKTSGLNPLAHYVLHGAAQGHNPSALFKASEYLRRYPESAGMNPLVHYFQTQELPAAVPVESRQAVPPAEESETGVFRIRQVGESGREDAKQDDRPLIVCISHVSGYPPRAGNDYRIFRMLTWLVERGYRVIMLIAPLPGEMVSDTQIAKLSEKLAGVALCDRSGRIRVSRSLFSTLGGLEGGPVTSFAATLGEDKSMSERDRQLLQIDRTFCHDALLAVLQEIHSKSVGRWALICEYIFMTRALPLLGDQTLKLIDTIDVFSSKSRKVNQYGINDSLALSSGEERARLLRADLVIAIQSAERDELAKLVPEKRVITVGVDFEVLRPTPQKGHLVFYIASDNAMNIKGLNDFLQLAWPWIRSEVPDATLKVAGTVCRILQESLPGVVALGPIEDVASVYREARLSINPAIAGTGLKIKTVESLCHLRPIVCWPSGVDGMQPELTALCFPVTNWRQFARRVIDILRDSREVWYTPEQAETIRRLLSPEHVYAPLDQPLRAFFEKQQSE